jgi:hypothetical protein
MSTWTAYNKPGGTWAYNAAVFTYNNVVSPVSGNPVLYNSDGVVASWTAETKS